MAIVKMKKLRLAVMARERKALLKELLLLGCVEISEPSELEAGDFPGLERCASGELMSDRADYALLTDAVKLMDKYAPAKGGFCPDHIDILRPLAGLDIYHNALLHNLQEPLGVEGLPPCSILLDAD